jgi:hypothetical protein
MDDSTSENSMLQGPFVIALFVMGLIYLSYRGLQSENNPTISIAEMIPDIRDKND